MRNLSLSLSLSLGHNSLSCLASYCAFAHLFNLTLHTSAFRYLRIWHGTVLSASDAASLYDDATATPGPTTGPSPTPTTAPSTPEPTTPVPSPAPTALPTWVKESSFPLPLKYHVQRGAGGLSGNDGGLEARMEDGCYGTQAADYDEGKCGPPGSGYAQNSAYGTGTNCNDGFGKCNTDSD